MTEEPYRWLEAVGNRREYVREQLKGGSPVLAASLPDGILLLGVGGGQSKVFELFDRQALAGLGHPADIEKIRQAAIDAAHVEAFTRAPEDVSLRRLVSFGLGPQLKTNFEQIFSAPFLVELLLAELATEADRDLLFRLHFDGSYKIQSGGVLMAASEPEAEAAGQKWLQESVKEQGQPRGSCGHFVAGVVVAVGEQVFHGFRARRGGATGGLARTCQRQSCGSRLAGKARPATGALSNV